MLGRAHQWGSENKDDVRIEQERGFFFFWFKFGGIETPDFMEKAG